jgi:hypothetical protein
VIQFKWVGYPGAKAIDEALDKQFKEAEGKAKTAPSAAIDFMTTLVSFVGGARQSVFHFFDGIGEGRTLVVRKLANLGVDALRAMASFKMGQENENTAAFP